VAESEWLDTLPTLPKTTKYIDQVAVAKKICEELREQGAQLIIAVTHSRAPNDIILAGGVPEIDIILGGHDHEYYIHNKNHIPILNSGCNFIEATVVTVSMGNNEGLAAEHYEEVKTEGAMMWEIRGPRATFKLDKIEVGSNYERDPELASLIDHFTQVVEEKKKKQLCYCTTALVASNNIVRSQESNVGNFICDIMKGLYKTDVAFIGGGTIRSNDIYGPGVITQGDMMNVFPFLDATVVFEILGVHIRYVLLLQCDYYVLKDTNNIIIIITITIITIITIIIIKGCIGERFF
jgi:5'-nucleotidase